MSVLPCRNIRHAMFQPATKSEVACLVHFHLHNPIMVGPKMLS